MKELAITLPLDVVERLVRLVDLLLDGTVSADDEDNTALRLVRREVEQVRALAK